MSKKKKNLELSVGSRDNVNTAIAVLRTCITSLCDDSASTVDKEAVINSLYFVVLPALTKLADEGNLIDFTLER